jgi:Ethanolamine utilization protein EutJ (predicted chaperonin)
MYEYIQCGPPRRSRHKDVGAHGLAINSVSGADNKSFFYIDGRDGSISSVIRVSQTKADILSQVMTWSEALCDGMLMKYAEALEVTKLGKAKLNPMYILLITM